MTHPRLWPLQQLHGPLRQLRVWVSVTLRSAKTEKLSPAARHRREVLATKGGPAVTALLSAALMAFYCLVFFEGMEPRSDLDGLRASGSCCGLATVLLALACHLVDPGTPRADPGDPGPAEDREEERIRARGLEDGQAWEQKFCRECRLWRPHRCGHCRYCRRCVLRLDHHCLFVGTCIGQHNMRFFAAFLLCAGAAFLHGLVAAVRCVRSGTCWSTHDRLDRWLGSTAGACVHTLYVLDGIMSLVMGAGVLTCAGVVYVVAMLGDMNLHNCRSLAGLFSELRKLQKCPGLQTYCLGPIARKAPVVPGAAAAAPWTL